MKQKYDAMAGNGKEAICPRENSVHGNRYVFHAMTETVAFKEKPQLFVEVQAVGFCLLLSLTVCVEVRLCRRESHVIFSMCQREIQRELSERNNGRAKKRGSRFEGEPRREVQVIFLSQASSPGLEWPERVDPAAERSTSSWQSQSEGLLGLLVNA
ncbi:MAG: hypothetical protein ACK557_08320, partial [Planctomycetota bacterium]